jgi:hypothetical protein
MKTECNNAISSATDCNKFIFFGCWNNINCKNEYIYRNIVLDNIAINETAINQLYIAGDNWYSNKKRINKSDFKLYFTEVLRTGYEKLYGMSKEIYIAVGNHDVASDATTDLLKKDCSINTQKYYLQQIKAALAVQAVEQVISVPTLELLRDKSEELKEDALCSNGIYIYVDNIGVRYNKDNIIIIINTNKLDDITSGYQYLEDVRRKIEEVKKEQGERGSHASSEQIFVMGHIPLFTFKKDKIAMHDIDKKKLEYRGLIAKLYEILADNSIIYLCADTHNFSIMKIEYKGKVVIQITAGTGGADPDLITGEFVDKPIEKVVKGYDSGSGSGGTKYTISAYALNSYGYVCIEILRSHIIVSYKQIITDKREKGYTTGDVKARPLSAPSNILDLKQDKPPVRRQNSLSAPKTHHTMLIKSRIVKYQIPRYANNVIYVSNTIVKTTFINSSKYKSKGICRNIETIPNGNVVSGVDKNLFCYKKDADKGNASKSNSKSISKTSKK